MKALLAITSIRNKLGITCHSFSPSIQQNLYLDGMHQHFSVPIEADVYRPEFLGFPGFWPLNKGFKTGAKYYEYMINMSS